MKLLLMLSTLVLHALAMPQSDDEFLSLLQGGDGDTPPLAGGQPACGDLSSDEAFLAAIQGRCGTSTGPEPVTRCERGEFTCTPYFRCTENNIVADRSAEFDLRIGLAQFNNDSEFITHSDCARFGDVCCTDPLPVNIGGGDITPETYVPQCGRRNDQGIGARITGFKKNESQFGEFPWMVAVLRVETIRDSSRSLFVCGGSLIDPNVVMTAAHCVEGLENERIVVRLGEWDTQNENEILRHVDIEVKSVIKHDNFNARRLNDDIALLELKRPATLRENIDTICLPPADVKFTQAECVASGWGKDAFQIGQFQTVLKVIPLPLVPHGQCEAALKKTRLRKYFRLDRSFTCAGGVDGKDTCTGDGGSPLACKDPNDPNGRYMQLGVVSWGIGCGLPDVPGVYADVSQQVRWIQKQMRRLQELA